MKNSLLLAFCASFSLAATARAGSNTFGILFCQADVVDSPNAELAIELPPTSGYTDKDGNPCAVWKVGAVAAGGVADSFFSENGPGAFQARNAGNRGAFVYVTSGTQAEAGIHLDSTSHDSDYYRRSLDNMFGYYDYSPCCSDPSRRDSQNLYYGLAVSTAVSSKVPVWRNLSWLYSAGTYTDVDGQGVGNCTWMNHENDEGVGMCGQYLGYLAAGETMLFDLKFYAPSGFPTTSSSGIPSTSFCFIVRVEASTFRRWGHDK